MARESLILVALAAAGCATVPESSTVTGPSEIVAARQAAFQLSGAAMGNMRAASEAGAEISGQAFAARGVARWAKALPGMFPASTRTVTPTRARPEIWANKADFEAKAAAYAAAAERLANAAQRNDRAAFAAELKATGATCAACHDLYQVPQQRDR